MYLRSCQTCLMDRFSKNDHMVDILEGLKYISINKSGKLMNSVQRIDGRIWSTKSFKIVPPTGLTKDVKELSWMSHRVIRFWFLLKFLFISAFFDILASLSISRVLSRPTKILLLRHSQNNYQMWLYKLSLMCEELSYQIINTSAVNQAAFCYY